MATKRATDTPEFKLPAVPMATEQKRSVAEAAGRLGVQEGRRHEWEKAHLRDGAAAFPGSGHQTPAEAELRQQRELVGHETDATRDEARASIVESVGVSDNRVRRHSPLGYISPRRVREDARPEPPL
jgi:transposase-like protein